MRGRPHVQLRLHGEDIRTTTGTSVRITGLSVDGYYEFQVRTVNPVGEGQWTQRTYANLHPSTSGQVLVSPTSINVNEGSTATYTIRLSTAPPHPVEVYAQGRGIDDGDIENAAHQYTSHLLVPNGWTHPDPDEAPYWADVIHNWSQGVRVTFTIPEDADTDDEIALMDHFVRQLPYEHYRPCRQETQAERDQCRQDWDNDWANAPYREFLTGASVIIRVRDND